MNTACIGAVRKREELCMHKSYEFAHNLIKKYKWNSILVKYWKKLLFIFLIPFIIINSIVYMMYHHVLQSEFYSSFRNSCSKTIYTLDTVFSEANTLFSQLANNTKALSFMTKPAETLHQSGTEANDLRELLHFFLVSREYIDSVYIYGVSHGYVFSTGNSNYLDKFADKAWYDYYEKTGETNFILPIRDKNTNEFDRIVLCYGVYAGASLNGMIVFTIPAKYINEMISADLSYSLDSLYILDQERNILYASNDDPNARIEESHIILPALSQGARQDPQLLNHHKDTYIRTDILSDRLTLVFRANPDYIGQRTGAINAVFLLCLITAILIPILMALYFSLQFYRSIHNIVVSLSADGTESNLDEVEFIIHNIMKITNTSKHFENELVQKIQQLKKAQSIALQLQFNPHFLFNTLNMVNVMVAGYAKNSNNDASRTIVLLSDLLYASMETNDYIPTLEEELAYAKKYIEILKIQYDNSFQLTWDIETDTLDCKVLKLMLQPIIENAFQHGMKLLPPGETFQIKISSQISNGCLLVCIHNNGNGIPEEKLLELRNMLENDDILQSKHIGLNNIHQRIKLLYGDQYGCSIDSGKDYFSVIIRLPVNR